jgi:uncharacterized membrane protein (DUF485 family)
MGSNEIRLRKQKLNPGRIARHRNYDELMRRHKRGLKTKQLLLVVIYVIIVLLLLLLSFIAIRLEKNKEEKSSYTPVEVKAISISTHLPLPWSDEQFGFASPNGKT